MKSNYQISGGRCLLQDDFVLDLHNDYDFKSLDYSVEKRTLCLHWKFTNRVSNSSNMPGAITIAFHDVNEFRFTPRDAGMPFTEDDCMATFGYWNEETGLFLPADDEVTSTEYPYTIDFMSGAEIIVMAERSEAIIRA